MRDIQLATRLALAAFAFLFFFANFVFFLLILFLKFYFIFFKCPSIDNLDSDSRDSSIEHFHDSQCFSVLDLQICVVHLQ